VLPALWIAAVGGGCATFSFTAGNKASSSLGPVGGRAITSEELDELTRAFADRYVGLLSSTCDELKRDNRNPVQRREAQALLLNCATNVYDIASNPDAFTRMLDLVVVTTLESQVWIDDDRTGDVFGDRGEVLVRALHHGRVEAWALAGQVLRPDQLDLLDYTIWDWRRHNPDMTRVPFVRFSNFAVGRGKSAAAEALAAGGFFEPVGEASKAVDQARLLTERMFYLAKREPTLLRWQAQALQDEALATPQVGQTLGDVHRLTDVAEQLPTRLASERKAIVATVDDHLKAVERTTMIVQATVAEANEAAATLGETAQSLNAMLKAADNLLLRYDGRQRWAASQPSRPFDVREYTQGVKELATALAQMNNVMKSSDELLGSSDWARRIEQVNASADGRMRIASERSEALVDVFFRRLYLALGAFFALLIVYRLFALLLIRRLGTATIDAAGKQKDNGHESAASSDQIDRTKGVSQ
jgi:hypothetical protein